MAHYKAMATFMHPDFVGKHILGRVYEYDSMPQFMIDSGYFKEVFMDVKNVNEVKVEEKEAKTEIKTKEYKGKRKTK